MLGVEVCKDRDETFAALPLSQRVVVGFSQAVSVRNIGFAAVPLVMYTLPFHGVLLLTMFIIAYPVTVTMRNTNLYLERGLGIYKEDINHEGTMQKRDHRSVLRWLARCWSIGLEEEYVFLRAQLRRLIARDIALVVSALFIIGFVENYRHHGPGYDIGAVGGLKIALEVLSAYGNVGMSFGVPNTFSSLCGAWHDVSKLTIIWVMIMGRQRGLPMALGHAPPSAIENVVDSAEGNFEGIEAEERERRLSHALQVSAEAESGTA